MSEKSIPKSARCSRCKRAAPKLLRLGDKCTFMKSRGSRTPCEGIIILPRRVTSEKRMRNFQRNGVGFRIEASWHYLDMKKHPDVKYHYVHVYRGNARLPFRWWRWVEYSNGQTKFLPSSAGSGYVSPTSERRLAN